ncbi:LacI family DNA-binding transcriptional regulator [Bifidobacterium aquikefiricola]|uniref:LacI family DNA-binding transcriptional regulator n=1 Tax=Bifidobacterium aquikefiricola TaxID=3059038 RepID=A0AB39U701_9BIFI
MNSNRTGKATRADVAELAQVSTAVVSYVMNNGPKKVAPQTASRVRQAAESLNYHPNAYARALRKGSGSLLGIIVPDFRNPYFALLNEAIEKEAYGRGYSTMFLTAHSDPELERKSIEKMVDREVDAIFMAPCQKVEELERLKDYECSFVMLENNVQIPGFACISSDFCEGVRLAIDHLVWHGRTNLVMFYGEDNSRDESRIRVWYEKHEEHGLRRGRVYRSRYTHESAYRAATAMLDAGERPDGIFVVSDFEAGGVLRALHEHGIRVPEDTSLISFDGTYFGLETWPQLTSVRQDIPRIARGALEAALNPDAPGMQIIPVDMTIRESCGCHVA